MNPHQAILDRIKPWLGELGHTGFDFKVAPHTRTVMTRLRGQRGPVQVTEVPQLVVYFSRSGGLPGPIPRGVVCVPMAPLERGKDDHGVWHGDEKPRTRRAA